MRNGLTTTNGIHVVIEDSRISPSIISEGLSVQPGTEVAIGLQKATISRLPDPFKSRCIDEYRYEPISGIAELSLFQYSAKNCKSWCYIHAILEF